MTEPLRPWSEEYQAERLHIRPRTLRAKLKEIEARFGVRPFHNVTKNRRVYHEDDSRQLQEALQWLSSSSSGDAARSGTSAAPSVDRLYSRARKLLTEPSPRMSASNAKVRSCNVVSMGPRRSLASSRQL